MQKVAYARICNIVEKIYYVVIKHQRDDKKYFFKNKMKKTTTKTTKEIIEDFLFSDSAGSTVTKFLLMTIAVGGVAFIGALAPALFSMAEGAGLRKKYSKKQLSNAFANLKNRKLVEIIQEKNGKTKVVLTNTGEKRIKELCFEELRIQKTKRWDKKWRVLVYDIPTKPVIYNTAREALRAKIKELGFLQLQKSVWVCPYECEDEILFLSESYHVTKFIEIFTVDRMLHGEKLKIKFGLK